MYNQFDYLNVFDTTIENRDITVDSIIKPLEDWSGYADILAITDETDKDRASSIRLILKEKLKDVMAQNLAVESTIRNVIAQLVWYYPSNTDMTDPLAFKDCTKYVYNLDTGIIFKGDGPNSRTVKYETFARQFPRDFDGDILLLRIIYMEVEIVFYALIGLTIGFFAKEATHADNNELLVYGLAIGAIIAGARLVFAGLLCLYFKIEAEKKGENPAPLPDSHRARANDFFRNHVLNVGMACSCILAVGAVGVVIGLLVKWFNPSDDIMENVDMGYLVGASIGAFIALCAYPSTYRDHYSPTGKPLRLDEISKGQHDRNHSRSSGPGLSDGLLSVPFEFI